MILMQVIFLEKMENLREEAQECMDVFTAKNYWIIQVNLFWTEHTNQKTITNKCWIYFLWSLIYCDFSVSVWIFLEYKFVNENRVDFYYDHRFLYKHGLSENSGTCSVFWIFRTFLK